VKIQVLFWGTLLFLESFKLPLFLPQKENFIHNFCERQSNCRKIKSARGAIIQKSPQPLLFTL
jgi:hypothetical protein